MNVDGVATAIKTGMVTVSVGDEWRDKRVVEKLRLFRIDGVGEERVSFREIDPATKQPLEGSKPRSVFHAGFRKNYSKMEG